jgi:glycosyltransferase involved in cell wall biosynthesis
VKPVSICIPSYKATHFKECLTSAIAQTYKNIEIIVSDDCPNDDIKCICEQFNGQVRYIRNPNPGGSGRNNINHLCAISRGEYLKFLFDDDILNPFCVHNLVESLDATADEAYPVVPGTTIYGIMTPLVRRLERTGRKDAANGQRALTYRVPAGIS